MCRKRVTTFSGVIGIMLALSGCGSMPGVSPNDDVNTDQVRSVKLLDFGDLSAKAGDVTWSSSSVLLANDSPLDSTSELFLTLDPIGISIFLAEASSFKRGEDRPRRAEVNFHFANEDQDACNSEDRVGPFEIAFENGTVTVSGPISGVGPNVERIVNRGRFSMCVTVWADFDGILSMGNVSLDHGQRQSGDKFAEICHIERCDDGDHGDDDEGHRDHEKSGRNDDQGHHGEGDDDDRADHDDDDVDDDHLGSDPCGRHTIRVGAAAVQAHLAHGDTMGPCDDDGPGMEDADLDGVPDELDACENTQAGEPIDTQGCSCAQLDSDGDGVVDCDDLCAGTPRGEIVNPDGCTKVVLAADAGADVTTFAGEAVLRVGSASVLEGTYDPADLIYHWEQIEGQATSFEFSSPPLTVQTEGLEGDYSFRLTVSTTDNSASAFDTFTITVMPVRIEGVSSARWHNSVWRNDGTMSLWGWDRYGRMGDGSLIDGVVSVSTAANHTLLAKSDGSCWTFGRNALTSSPVPLAVPLAVSVASEIIQVAALANGGLMLDASGTVWGFTDAGNTGCALAEAAGTGDGSALGPIPVPGLPENIVAIETGSYHGMALDADGNAWVWGARFGCTPWIALDNVSRISAGTTNLCLFVRGDGSAWGMGFNLHGQLGNGTTVSNYSTPTQVVGLGNVFSVAAGDRHSLFLLDDGTLWTSGWNHDCQLGLEAEVSPTEPTFGTTVLAPVQVDLVNVVDISAGYAHSLAVTDDETVWGWGLNNVGQFTGGSSTSLPSTVCMPMPIDLGE